MLVALVVLGGVGWLFEDQKLSDATTVARSGRPDPFKSVFGRGNCNPLFIFDMSGTDEDPAPAPFLCPITMDVMEEPVVATDGRSCKPHPPPLRLMRRPFRPRLPSSNLMSPPLPFQSYRRAGGDRAGAGAEPALADHPGTAGPRCPGPQPRAERGKCLFNLGFPTFSVFRAPHPTRVVVRFPLTPVVTAC